MIMLAAPVAAVSEWIIQTVDSTGNAGQDTSLALDSSGFPRISYYDVSESALKYAQWDGSAWDIQTVDNSADVGNYTSLALDSSDRPHISYYDVSDTALKYAEWDGSAWDIQTVDNSADVGRYTSLALDSSGTPHISYFDRTDCVLKYAVWDGAGWSITTLDNYYAGTYTSLALDSSEAPHISYSHIVWYSSLRYAAWNGAVWSTETVEDGYAYYTSLALDSSDRPHISYYGVSDTALKYAEWDGSAWDIQTVDNSADVGKYTSLALDSSDRPHISYYGVSDTALKYAEWDGSAWDIHTVDNSADVGQYSSLALDSSDNPRISYYDATNGVLKYADGQGLRPSFSASPVSGNPPLTVTFTDTTLGSPTYWGWSFGDGDLSGLQNPVHTYTMPGTYTVSLFVSAGTIHNVTAVNNYITVTDPGSPAVVSGFTASPTSGTAPLTVDFTDESTNTPTSWDWNFGSWSAADHGVSTEQNPSHTYAAAGTYTISLSARNTNGGDTFIREDYITVTAAPVTTGPTAAPGGSSSGTSTSASSDNSGGSDTGTGPAPVKKGDIDFFVTSSYLSDHNVAPSDVEMLSFSGGRWSALPTRFTGSSGNRFYFTADSDTYSLLAIGNKKDGMTGIPVLAGTTSPAPASYWTAVATYPAPETESRVVAREETAVPVMQQPAAEPPVPAEASPGSPVFPLIPAFLSLCCIGLIAGGWYARRWWIRRQNPALFREYD
jgi:PKD repeat protein